jgi:hypothetical protein
MENLSWICFIHLDHGEKEYVEVIVSFAAVG